MPDRTTVLHFGSIASWTSPGAARVIELGRRMRDRGDVLVSYDPNIRPSLLGDRDQAQRMVERGLRVAHVAKASAEESRGCIPASRRKTSRGTGTSWG